jgi:hypothetical protein
VTEEPKAPTPSLLKDVYDLQAEGFRGLPIRPLTSVSGLRAFMTCPRRYFWEHVANIQPKGVPSSFAIGRLIHEMLAAFFASGRKAEKMKEVMDSFREYGESAVLDGKSLEDFELALACARGVLDDFPGWEATRVPELKVLATEWPFQKATSRCGLSGRIDNLGAVDEGPLEGRWVIDHKTHALGRSDEILDKTPFDKQARLYAFETGSKGIVWTFIAKTAARRRQNESRQDYLDRVAADYKAEPAKFFRREYERLPQAEAVLDEIKGVQSLHGCARGRYKALGPAAFPQNEGACHAFGRCPYLDACRGGPFGIYRIGGKAHGDNDARAALGAGPASGEAGAGLEA